MVMSEASKPSLWQLLSLDSLGCLGASERMRTDVRFLMGDGIKVVVASWAKWQGMVKLGRGTCRL